MRILLLLSLGLFMLACNAEPKENVSNEPPEAAEPIMSEVERIVDQVVQRHGGDLYKNSMVRFTFRDRVYKATRRGGSFEYERLFTNDAGEEVRDVLNNSGLYREINGARVALTAKDSSAYANSVNSVLYFALLPYFLNDQAVNKEYLGEVTIKNEPYHKIKATFEQQGGGKDFEDVYVYWFHRDSLTMDYLAYNYQTDGGGARFREAYNILNVNGIRFADYINFKPKDERNLDVETFDRLFEQGDLEELSRIDSENIEVILLSE